MYYFNFIYTNVIYLCLFVKGITLLKNKLEVPKTLE